MPEASLRVFLVEDDADIRSLFEAALAMRGYTVDTAPNGQDALAILEAATALPAVIVADLHMPVMDGWQLLTALSEHPRLSAIPVVVLTAADDATRTAPRPQTVLIKPVAIDDLTRAIHDAARSAG